MEATAITATRTEQRLETPPVLVAGGVCRLTSWQLNSASRNPTDVGEIWWSHVFAERDQCVGS
jgi:hypothetical protein